MTSRAVPFNTNTLKNGDLSVVLHIPSAVAAEVFKGVHPLLGREVHIDIYDLGEM